MLFSLADAIFSIPEFYKSTGNSADGLISAVGIRKLNKYEYYRQRWNALFKKEPAGHFTLATHGGLACGPTL